MINICFVCLGNICRSPMAEAVMKKIAEERGFSQSLEITSFATSDCEEGNPVYFPVARLLKEEGYNFTHISKQLTKKDVINNDYILVMDSANLFDVLKIAGAENGGKIYKLGSFSDKPFDIADPWYTRDFRRTYSEICDCCNNFADYLFARHAEIFSYDKRHNP